MNDMAISRPDAEGNISLEQPAYEAWRDCVRRLLGWTGGDRADWPALFASGHTPRDAARAAVYGESLGD